MFGTFSTAETGT